MPSVSGKPKYIFYSGKGGVGKTSIAAASALHYSRTGRVLIISTDPAHSLSDSFEIKIGADIKSIANNLDAVEIDPKKSMDEYRERFTQQVQGMQALKGFGLDDIFSMADSAPGIDELAAIDKFLQYMNSREYDTIIFDTAPTGHTLRLLSLPEVLDSWVGKVIKLRMKMASLMGMFKTLMPFAQDSDESMGTEQLEKMKERISTARKFLTDPKTTSFYIVTIPEAMSIFESERALQTLREYRIPVAGMIVNQLIPDNKSCTFCSARRKMQQLNLMDIKERFKKLQIRQVQLFDHELKGRHLAKLSTALYSS